MKFIFTLLIFSLTQLVFASGQIQSSQWVKVSDGTFAFCRNKADVVRNNHQAYVLKKKSVSLVNEALQLNLEIGFVQCVKQDGGFKFITQNPYDLFTFENIYLSGDLKTVEVETEWIKAIIYRDGIYKVLFKDVVDDNLNLNVTIQLTDLLTEEELNQLDQGESVRASFDFMLNRKIISHALSSSNTPSRNVIRYGSFRQWIVLKKIDGKVLIRTGR